MQRTAVYVDGHYVHNALRKLGLDEKAVAWPALFARCASGAGIAGPLERVRWHAAAAVAGVDFTGSRATRYCPPGTDEATFLADARAWYDAERARVEAQPAAAAEAVRLEAPADVRVAPTGSLALNPYQRALVRVDGIDVGIAVDLVTEIDYVDAAVVLAESSGLTPAIRFLRERHKRVVRATIVTAVESDAFDDAVVIREDELNDRASPLLSV